MDQVLKITKALADRSRLRIVMAMITHKELCACQIIELLNLAGATVSRHLALLISAGLLKSRKEGRWIYYWINSNQTNKPLIAWLKSELRKSKNLQADHSALNNILANNPVNSCQKTN